MHSVELRTGKKKPEHQELGPGNNATAADVGLSPPAISVCNSSPTQQRYKDSLFQLLSEHGDPIHQNMRADYFTPPSPLPSSLQPLARLGHVAFPDPEQPGI